MPAVAIRSSRWVEWGSALILGVLLLALARESALRSVDFPVYHRVAREMLAGDYTIYPAAVFEGGPIPSHGFRYAPAIAFLMMPIGWLPLELAALLLYAAKLAAAAYIGTVVARRAGLGTTSSRYMVAAFLIVGGYVAEEFRYGNVHFLVVALMVYAFDAVESGQTLRPATALALAIATKLTPIALLAYFALRRRVAACVATAAVLVALAFLPAAVVGVRENTRLLRGFATYAVQKVDEQDNYAWRGVLVKYLTAEHAGDISHLPMSMADLSPSAVTALWLLGVGAMGIVALIAVGPESQNPTVRLLELSLVLTGVVLAAPHTQRRYFVALYVPVAALLAVIARHRDTISKRAIVVGIAATALSGTILPLVFGGRRLALMYEATSPYFFGTLVLFGVLAFVTVRLKREAAPRPFADSSAQESSAQSMK